MSRSLYDRVVLPIDPGAFVSTAATRPVVLLAEKLAPSAVSLLGDNVEIRHVDGTDRPALLAALADADALLVRSATKVDAEVFAASNRLRSSRARASGSTTSTCPRPRPAA